MQDHNDDTIITTSEDTSLEKYTSRLLKGLCVRGSWRRTELQHIDLPTLLAITVFLSRSAGLLNQRPGGPAVFSTVSFFQLSDLQNWLIGGLRAPSATCWLSLISNSSDPQNSFNFLCTELYNSSTPTQYLTITGHRNMHFRLLCNGIFDRHRAEITVMQFTGHSLPVHQFLTVLWDFNPVPYCQLSSPTAMEYITSAVFGMACLAGPEVNILHRNL